MTQILSERVDSGPLTPAAAISRARAMLRQHGFHDVAESTRGDSFYLGRPEGGGGIRVSTHRRTPKRRAQYPGVATSIVIDRPTSEAKLRARVEAAIRDAAARAAGAGDLDTGDTETREARHAP